MPHQKPIADFVTCLDVYAQNNQTAINECEKKGDGLFGQHKTESDLRKIEQAYLAPFIGRVSAIIAKRPGAAHSPQLFNEAARGGEKEKAAPVNMREHEINIAAALFKEVKSAWKDSFNFHQQLFKAGATRGGNIDTTHGITHSPLNFNNQEDFNSALQAGRGTRAHQVLTEMYNGLRYDSLYVHFPKPTLERISDHPTEPYGGGCRSFRY